MKPFTKIACVLLGLISLGQLTRFLMGWVVTVNCVVIPVWLSLEASLVDGGLAVMVWKEARP